MAEVDEALAVLMRSGEMTVRILQDTGEILVPLIRALLTRHEKDGQQPAAHLAAKEDIKACRLREKDLPKFRQAAKKENLSYALTDADGPGCHAVCVPAADLQKGAGIVEDVQGAPAQMTAPGDIDRGILTYADTYQPLLQMDLPDSEAARFLAKAEEKAVACAAGTEAQMLRDHELRLDAVEALTKYAAGRTPEERAAIEKHWPLVKDAEPEAVYVKELPDAGALAGIPVVPIPDRDGILCVFRREDREKLPFQSEDVHRLIAPGELKARLEKISAPGITSVLLPEREKERAEAVLSQEGIRVPHMRRAATTEECRRPLQDRLTQMRREAPAEEKYWCITLPPHQAGIFRSAIGHAHLPAARIPQENGMQFLLCDEYRTLAGSLLSRYNLQGGLRRAEKPEVALARRQCPEFFTPRAKETGPLQPMPERGIGRQEI